jgi:hypothetical protein
MHFNSFLRHVRLPSAPDVEGGFAPAQFFSCDGRYPAVAFAPSPCSRRTNTINSSGAVSETAQ